MTLQAVYSDLNVWTLYLAKNKYNEIYIGCTSQLGVIRKDFINGTYFRTKPNVAAKYKDLHFSLEKCIYTGPYPDAAKFIRWLHRYQNQEELFTEEQFNSFKNNIMLSIYDNHRERIAIMACSDN